MSDKMYRLDFRRGVVEHIDGTTPPRGCPTAPDAAADRAGCVEFATLGTPPGMTGEPTRDRAIQARPLTVEEYERLVELGVLGEQVELVAGRITFGRYPFAFSDAAVAAARAAGIELTEPPVSREREVPQQRQEPREWRPSPALSAAAEAMLTRERWQVLERVVLILTQEGAASLTLATSWCGTQDDALDGLSPAAWLEAGRDPETLFLLAHRDAARLAQ